jgi:O-antigen/teichoic acid export membrane protein
LGKFLQLFKQTFIYGIATVFPRIISVLLVRIHTDKSVISEVSEFGNLSLIFSYIILFNVILSYGLETSFFRFYNLEKNKNDVVNTSSVSLIFTTIIFVALFGIFKSNISLLTGIDTGYLSIIVWILAFDVLTVIPFAYLRLKGKAIKYSYIKIANVLVYFSLNIFLLIFLKDLANDNTFLRKIYIENFEVSYIFIANLFASLTSLLLLIPFYFKINYRANFRLLKKMLFYAFPILISGLAYTINETFDKILLDFLLPESIAKTEIGMYSACYKLAVFMTLFSVAYKLAVEPFFFSEAEKLNPKKNYALVLETYVIIGSSILVLVVVSLDLLKVVFIGDQEYWKAMKIVPIILLANFCLGIYQNLSVWYKVTDRTRFGAYISIVGALFTLIINIILIPIYGYLGSALATLAAYLTMSVLSYFMGQKYYPIPYNNFKILFYISAAVFLSYVSFYIFRNNLIVGITCVLIMNLVIYINEKSRIYNFLKALK